MSRLLRSGLPFGLKSRWILNLVMIRPLFLKMHLVLHFDSAVTVVRLSVMLRMLWMACGIPRDTAVGGRGQCSLRFGRDRWILGGAEVRQARVFRLVIAEAGRWLQILSFFSRALLKRRGYLGVWVSRCRDPLQREGRLEMLHIWTAWRKDGKRNG